VSVTLLIRYANGIHRIVLSLVSCPAVPYVATLSHKLHDFRTKYAQNIVITNKCTFNIYDVIYSQCSHQHVSAGIPAIFRVRFLVQECKLTYRSFATSV
jgi:hypothetical protein